MSPQTLPSKDEIRSRHRKIRAGMPAGALSAAADGIAAPRTGLGRSDRGRRPATFHRLPGRGPEPPTLPLITALHECRPQCAAPGLRAGPRAELGATGIRTASLSAAGTRPSRSRPENATAWRPSREVAGMFLPATAVDLSGNRIGQGGGYYDKFLAARRTPRGLHAPRAAVIYDSELLPASTIPAEELRPARRRGAHALGLGSAWRDATRGKVIELALRPCDC